MASGYNKARDAAEQMGRAAFAAGKPRSCFQDPQWLELWKEWSPKELRRANQLGMQWYRGWDRANCAAIVAL